MKRKIIILWVLCLISLTACSSDDKNVSTDKDFVNDIPLTPTTPITPSSAPDKSEQDSNNITPETNEKVYTLIPKAMAEAVEIEDGYRKGINDVSHVEKDIAATEAFNSMKIEKEKYAEELEAELDENQKLLFESYIETEKAFNIYFDMLSQNALSYFVFTGGSASCNESYNLIRLETVIMYYYSSSLKNEVLDKTAINEIINADLDEFMFFTDSEFDWSQENTDEIYENAKETLFEYLNEDSKRVIEEYDEAYQELVASLLKFEESIGVEKTDCYNALNAAFFNSLKEIFESGEMPNEMIENANLELSKEDFESRWN